MNKNQVAKIELAVSNAVNNAEHALVEKKLQASAEKAELISKNITARFRTIETFKNASVESIALIVKHSDEATLNYLLDASNYKTAQRILDCANMLTKSSKYSSIIDYTLSAIKRSSLEKTSIDTLCASANQCYSRLANAVKALYFFDLIEVDQAQTNKRLIVRMSKNTTISLKQA